MCVHVCVGKNYTVAFALDQLPLTPTFVNVAGAYSVRYFANLVIYDDQDNQVGNLDQEIVLSR